MKSNEELELFPTGQWMAGYTLGEETVIIKSDGQNSGLEKWIPDGGDAFFGLDRGNKPLAELRPNIKITIWERLVFWLRNIFT